MLAHPAPQTESKEEKRAGKKKKAERGKLPLSAFVYRPVMPSADSGHYRTLPIGRTQLRFPACRRTKKMPEEDSIRIGRV